MKPFTCRNCKAETMRLIATKDDLKCPNCYKLERPRSTDLHQYDNKDAPKMSRVKEEVIKNRVRTADGRFIDRRTGKPSEK